MARNGGNIFRPKRIAPTRGVPAGGEAVADALLAFATASSFSGYMHIYSAFGSIPP